MEDCSAVCQMFCADDAGSREAVVFTDHASKFVGGKGGRMIHLTGITPGRQGSLGQYSF